MIGTEVIVDYACEEAENSQSLTSLMDRDCWDDVRDRLDTYPDYASECQTIHLFGQKTRAYPLHFACRKKKIPEDIMSLLIDLFPKALREPDSRFENLPIHIACRSGQPVNVITRLITQYPESLRIANDEKNLPFHLVCSFGSMDVVALVARKCQHSQMFEAVNTKQQTPLHLACSRYDVSESVVKQLVEGSPKACATADWQGQLPLHKAVMWKVESEIIEFLLKSYPDAVRILDIHKLTPYGVCRKHRRHGSSEETVKLLRRYHSKSGASHLRLRDALRFNIEKVGDAVISPPGRRAAPIKGVAMSC